MILFLMKKWFWNFWDNMGLILLLNLGYILLMALPFLLPELISMPVIFYFILLFITGIILSVYTGAVTRSLYVVSTNQSLYFSDFKLFFKESWKKSAFFALIFIPLCFMSVFLISFYTGLKNIAGFGGASIVFWISILILVSAQFYFPLCAEMPQDNFKKTVKKSFLLFFDNTGSSIFTFIFSGILLVLSVFLVLLIPGISGLVLLHISAVRLFMMKYDYQEANPDKKVKGEVWDAVLYEEREKLGKHTLKGMIFPWKE